MKVVFEKSHFHNYTNKISPKYTLIKKSLQDKFYTNQKPILVNHDSTVLNIAFHIRRGDVNQADIARFTDNERIFSTLQTITQTLQVLHQSLRRPPKYAYLDAVNWLINDARCQQAS